jgi:Protein of unknown function (DUF3300)
MRMRALVAIVLLTSCLACQDTTSAQQGQSKSKPLDLDSLLAPVALYPDQLLAHMLLAAADPAKVVALNLWLGSNTTLKGTELQDAATVEGFDPSLVAMTLFPNLVKFMAEQLDWTTQLGKAFAANKTAVFDTIQRLRKSAQAKGALKDTPQQEVGTKTTSSGQEVIVIEPANPQVIYVPQYNPQVVYTQPPATTIVIQEDDDDDEIIAGVVGFTAGIALGAAINNNYYYGPYGWGGGAYMYNDAWDDYYDHREDAREDWMDHREDLVEERGERAGDAREQRTERSENRQETRGDGQSQRTERTETRQENRPESQTRSAGTQARSADTQTRTSTPSTGTRGHSQGAERSTAARSGTSSDAFSGYSSGRSERAASSRGGQSRSSSRGGGGGGGRRR